MAERINRIFSEKMVNLGFLWGWGGLNMFFNSCLLDVYMLIIKFVDKTEKLFLKLKHNFWTSGFSFTMQSS